MKYAIVLLSAVATYLVQVQAFSTTFVSSRKVLGENLIRLYDASSAEPETAKDPKEIIACRIQIQGAAQGGYFRACVKNEARRFRNLIGTMSPPSEDPDAVAEIYVEGKRKMIEGFVRWCEKGDVGLNQLSKVLSVSYDELPTGLYEDFYVDAK